jgi:uncharacterized LabA/DUF88 family protein
MSKKAIIFVDANNWYHNVSHYFKPGEIDIIKIVDLICKIKDFNSIEIRWYNSIPNIQDGESMYYKHMSFLSNLEKKGIKVITRKLQRLSNKEIIIKKRETIDNLELCNVCKPLIESVFLDLADIKKKEKGIDVWIAVDMIKASVIDKNCDVCILISGDTDFVPALDIIKKQGKEVLTAMVPNGYSSELRQKFPYIILNKEKLIQCLQDWNKKIK